MLVTAERLEGESSLDDAGAGDKARWREDTEATLEYEHERQKRQQRNCTRKLGSSILVSLYIVLLSGKQLAAR